MAVLEHKVFHTHTEVTHCNRILLVTSKMVGGVRRSVSETGLTAVSNYRTFSRSVSLNPATPARNQTIYDLLKNARSILQEFMKEYVRIESSSIDIDSPTITADAVSVLPGLSDLSDDSVVQIPTLQRIQLLLKRIIAALPLTIPQSKDYTSLVGLLQRVDQDQLESLSNYLKNNWQSHMNHAGAMDNVTLPDDLVIQMPSPREILNTSVIIRQYFDNCLATFSAY